MEVALGLGLTDTGFDFSVLSEFRTRVAGHGLEARALDLLVAALVDKGLIRARGKARTDSTHVLAAVRDLNRPELAGESVRAALEAIAAAAAQWLAEALDVTRSTSAARPASHDRTRGGRSMGRILSVQARRTYSRM